MRMLPGSGRFRGPFEAGLFPHYVMCPSVPEPSIWREQPKKVKRTRSCPEAPATVERNVPALSGLKRKETRDLGGHFQLRRNLGATENISSAREQAVEGAWPRSCFQMQTRGSQEGSPGPPAKPFEVFQRCRRVCKSQLFLHCFQKCFLLIHLFFKVLF